MSARSQSVSDIEQVVANAEALGYPTPSDVRYPYKEWRDVLQPLSAQEAIDASKRASDEFVSDVLAGASFVKNGDRDRLQAAIPIRAENDEASVRRVENRAISALTTLPLVTASMLCGWIQYISVYDRDYYKENVRESIGYYHPEEHFIEVASDVSDPSHHWARNSEHTTVPEYSTTIHEIGHALHYMNGVRTKHPDTLNNNERTSVALDLVSGIQRDEWQEGFLWDGIEGYFNVWDGRYDHLRALSKHQKRTLEEYYAIAFEAWITAPDALYEEQPIGWRAFERLP